MAVPFANEWKIGFTRLQLHGYVEVHLRTTPELARTELIQQLESAIATLSCRCLLSVRGADMDICVGADWAGLLCLHHRADRSDHDYEIDVAEDAAG